ncbi:unnamed protein product [Moneuplotes crassus]|uniref:Tubulin-tyrosine ligase family protein n=2 Tax=Euplotes crassus TaxID=5936 RepID=A0AAD1XNJ0_EUPCR|nr:unnamed protein product [Moneuplotes crassus]
MVLAKKRRQDSFSKQSDGNDLMIQGNDSFIKHTCDTQGRREPVVPKMRFGPNFPQIDKTFDNSQLSKHIESTPTEKESKVSFQVKSSNMNKLIQKGLLVCKLSETSSQKNAHGSLLNYYKKSSKNRNSGMKNQKSEYFTKAHEKTIDFSTQKKKRISQSSTNSASKGSIKKGSNVVRNRVEGPMSIKIDSDSSFMPPLNNHTVSAKNHDSIKEDFASALEEREENLWNELREEDSFISERYRKSKRIFHKHRKGISSLNPPSTPTKIHMDNGFDISTFIKNLNSISMRKFGSPMKGPIICQDPSQIMRERYIQSKRILDEDELQKLLINKKLNINTHKFCRDHIKFPVIEEHLKNSESKTNKTIFKTKKACHRNRFREHEEHQLLIKKLDTRLDKLKGALKKGNTSNKKLKPESLHMSSKIKFPFKMSEEPEKPKIGKNSVKPRLKGPEYFQVKIEEKVRSIQKSNLVPSKYKEIVSRSVHEYCTDSPFNTLLRNFSDFITLASGKTDSREDANIISELSKKLGVKPKKNMFLKYYSSNEFVDEVRSKALEKFLSIINTQNCIKNISEEDEKQPDIIKRNNGFKAFIQRGNHGTIVKTMLNRRSWWSIQDSHEENYETTDFIWTQWIKQPIVESLPIDPTEDPPLRTYGKLEGNFHLSNKNSLTDNLTNYYKATDEDVTENIPLTFLVSGGSKDSSFSNFREYFSKISLQDTEENHWICKPGENSNRGQHICVLDDLSMIEDYVNMGVRDCYIIQKYISNPLLINKRKFDIRCFSLLTSINGQNHAFFYQDGYLRTASKEYSPDDLDDKFVHLTNDAIQKKSEDYGKYESSNKLSFQDFEKYLEQNYPEQNEEGPGCFYTHIYPQIKKLVRDTFLASEGKINPKKRSNCFELFGYDFMVTEDFKVYLIEVNTNPCLETPCSLLSRIISSVLDNSFRIALDPLTHLHNGKMIFLGDSTNNLSKFELVYSSKDQ